MILQDNIPTKRCAGADTPSRLGRALALAAVLSVALAGVRARAEEPATAPPKVIILDDPNAIKAAAGTGQVFPIKVTEKPLKQVLDFLSQISRLNIRALREKEEKMLVSMDLESVTYRGVLDYLSKKYGLLIDDSKIDQKLIFVSSPPKVSMIFTRADIRDVINTIAMQAGANIVIGPEVTGEISMRLEDVPWRDALNIVVKTLDFVAVPEANETLRITTPNRLASQLQTRIFRLAYLTPDSAKYVATLTSEFARREESQESAKAGQTLFDVLTNMKGPEGKLSFLKRGTALIVTDTATKLDTMEMVVKKLDVAPKQIFVSVKIIVITDTDLERLGVDWGNGLQFNLTPAITGPQATSFPFDVGAGLIRGMLGNWTGALSTFRGIAAAPNFNTTATASQGNLIGTAGYNSNAGGVNSSTTALFDAIRTKTNSKVVQSPQLMTLDNEEATIQVGQLFRYAESFVANTEGGGNVAGFREAAGSPVKLGLQLLIIPHVTGPENNVLMTVIPKTEDLDRVDSFNGGNGLILQLPQTTQRIVVTRMLLRSNETGVIAGLRINRDRRVDSAVPIFSEIPILGRLFKHRIHDGGVALGTGQPTSESLMVFVTPTIVDIDVRDDFKSQLESIRNEVSHSFAPIGGEEISPAK
ncbi:MAG: hypothetical protein HY291_23995 [Planctomycetes bacterium]|nr:hypothetical protein [Planctomycetota bacterium]